jgi:hypothetical protein
MLKALKLLVLVGLVAGLLFLLPFGGRTLFDRWRAARGAGDFAARTWAEMRGGPVPLDPAQPPTTRKAKPGKPAAAGEPPPGADQPLETTTDAERKSLDKLLDQHLSEQPKR